MSVYRVIDRLESLVKSGTVLPLGYRVVSEEKVLELVEKLRASLPEEVGRAKWIAKDEQRRLREAEAKAETIVREASQTHAELLDDHELVQRARVTAETVLREAETRAARVREGADAYAAGVLADLDARLTTAQGSVKKGLEALAVSKARQLDAAPAASSVLEAAANAKRAAFDAQAAEGAAETSTLERV